MGGLRRNVRKSARVRRGLALLTALMVSGLLPAGPAEAKKPSPPPAPDGHFSCRASLLRVDGEGLLGSLFLEPIVANSAGEPCVSDAAGVLNEQLAVDALGLSVGLKLLYADTVKDGSNSATAETGVAALRIELGGVLGLPLGGVVIEVEVLTAEAAAECPGPGLRGESTVVGLRINGLEVDVPLGQQPLSVTLPLGLGGLHLNQTTLTGDTVTQRALYLDTILADVVVAEAIADVHGRPCGQPPKPPRTPRGWMSGGGSISGSPRVTHGMRLECVKGDGPNNLQVNWPQNGFHLESVTSAKCSNGAGIDPGQPRSTFDTLVGTGTGRCRNGGTASAYWTVTDAGEPGTADTMSIRITGGCSLNRAGALDRGNHQAHQRLA